MKSSPKVLFCISFIASSQLSVSSSPDRKSTRLNSSHLVISYAVFCLKKKKTLSFITACAVLHDPANGSITQAPYSAATFDTCDINATHSLLDQPPLPPRALALTSPSP